MNHPISIIISQSGLAHPKDWESQMLQDWQKYSVLHGTAIGQANIAEGELLIASRPIELIRPGDQDWQYHADMAFLEADHSILSVFFCALAIL